jgi:MFS family permease
VKSPRQPDPTPLVPARVTRTRVGPPLFTRYFLLLVVGHFLQALGWASSILLPLYLDHLEATRTEIGAIMAAGSIGGLLFRPVVAWSLDTLGRKPTLVAGTLVLATAVALVFFVREVGWFAYAQRFLYGIGVGALFTGYFTFAVDYIPVERRTEGIALFGVSGLLPLALSPIVDGIGLQGEALLYVFPAASLGILASLLALAPVPESRRQPPPEPVRLRPVLRALRQPPLRPVWLAAVVFSCLVATFMTFATVVAEGRGMARPTHLWVAYAAGAIGIRVFGGRLPDRIGPANLIAPALALYVAASLLVAASWSASGFIVAGGLAGLGHGYCFPVLTSQVVTRSPEHLRGTGLTMFTSLWELSALLLTPLFGRVADLFDDATMFSLLALSGVLVLAFWVRLEHRHGGERGASGAAAAPVEGEGHA